MNHSALRRRKLARQGDTNQDGEISRNELQAMAKAKGIKANQTSAALRAALGL